MTQATLVKLKFKEGKKQDWLNWCEELKKRKDEVIETLKNEGVVSESCFISEDGQALYYFMEAHDFDKAKEAVHKSEFPIDKEHRKIRIASIEKVAELKPLFHFENRD